MPLIAHFRWIFGHRLGLAGSDHQVALADVAPAVARSAPHAAVLLVVRIGQAGESVQSWSSVCPQLVPRNAVPPL